MMLLELQWLSHDLGLEVTDDDLATWALNCRPEDAPLDSIKTEPVDESSEDPVPGVPTPAEAADYLARALLWMETEPLDPALLLVVRDIITIAKQARLVDPCPLLLLPRQTCWHIWLWYFHLRDRPVGMFGSIISTGGTDFLTYLVLVFPLAEQICGIFAFSISTGGSDLLAYLFLVFPLAGQTCWHIWF
jgi:hypothetical protein